VAFEDSLFDLRCNATTRTANSEVDERRERAILSKTSEKLCHTKAVQQEEHVLMQAFTRSKTRCEASSATIGSELGAPLNGAKDKGQQMVQNKVVYRHVNGHALPEERRLRDAYSGSALPEERRLRGVGGDYSDSGSNEFSESEVQDSESSTAPASSNTSTHSSGHNVAPNSHARRPSRGFSGVTYTPLRGQNPAQLPSKPTSAAHNGTARQMRESANNVPATSRGSPARDTGPALDSTRSLHAHVEHHVAGAQKRKRSGSSNSSPESTVPQTQQRHRIPSETADAIRRAFTDLHPRELTHTLDQLERTLGRNRASIYNHAVKQGYWHPGDARAKRTPHQYAKTKMTSAPQVGSPAIERVGVAAPAPTERALTVQEDREISQAYRADVAQRGDIAVRMVLVAELARTLNRPIGQIKRRLLELREREEDP
jgi:hypothetical protein